MGKLSGLKKVVDGALDMSRKARMQRAFEQGYIPVRKAPDYMFIPKTYEDIKHEAATAGFDSIDEYYSSIIKKVQEKTGAEHFGLRAMTPVREYIPDGGMADYRLGVGDDVSPSYNTLADPDIETGQYPDPELLSGASSVGVGYDYFDDSLDGVTSHLKKSEMYSGKEYPRVLVGGSRAESGNDPWEEIIDDAVIHGHIDSIRSANAAFDPTKKDSSNLLASMGGAAVLGGTALGSNEADAYSPISDFVQRRQAKKQHWTDVRDSIANLKPHAFVESPSSSVASTLADYSHKYNQYIDSRPLLQLAAPEAPEELLRKISYDDERTASDYILAGLGMAP